MQNRVKNPLILEALKSPSVEALYQEVPPAATPIEIENDPNVWSGRALQEFLSRQR